VEDKIIEETEKSIKELLEEGEGLTTNNLDYIYKLSKIKHMAKEDKNMYGNYMGRGPSRGSYGEYGRGGYGNYEGYGEYGNEYGRRGYDSKYRGEEQLDRMHGEYGRYMENRSRYGAGEETDRSFHYMVKALEDFIKVLYEEAGNEQQKNQLRETLQRSVM
jgi:hypothetical protein